MAIVLTIPTPQDAVQRGKEDISSLLDGVVAPFKQLSSYVERIKTLPSEAKEKVVSPFAGIKDVPKRLLGVDVLKGEMEDVKSELSEIKTHTQEIAERIHVLASLNEGIKEEIQEQTRQEWQMERDRKKAETEKKFETAREVSKVVASGGGKEGQSIWGSLFSGTFSGTLAGSLTKRFGGILSKLAANGLVSFIGSGLKLSFSLMTRILPSILNGVFSSSAVAKKLGIEGNWETFIAGMLGGAESGLMNAFKNAGVWALQGATLGAFGGPVGILVGGLVGGALGAILGYFGGERIYEWMQAGKKLVVDSFTFMRDAIMGSINRVSDFLLGTTRTLSEKDKERFRELKQREDSLVNRLMELQKEISSLQWKYYRAVLSGDMQEASRLQERIKSLNEQQTTIQKQIDEIEKEKQKLNPTLAGSIYQTYATVRDWVKDVVALGQERISTTIDKMKERIKKFGENLNLKEISKKIKDLVLFPVHLLKKSVDRFLKLLPNSIRKMMGFKDAVIEDVDREVERLNPAISHKSQMPEVVISGEKLQLLDKMAFQKDVEQKKIEVQILKEFVVGADGGGKVKQPQVQNQNIVNSVTNQTQQIITMKTTPFNPEPNVGVLEMRLRGMR